MRLNLEAEEKESGDWKSKIKSNKTEMVSLAQSEHDQDIYINLKVKRNFEPFHGEWHQLKWRAGLYKIY